MSDHSMFYPFPIDKMGNDAGNMIRDAKVVQMFCLDLASDIERAGQGGRASSPFCVPKTTEVQAQGVYKKVLGELPASTTLYVCGHCAPGGTTFQAPDYDFEITADTLASYLRCLPKNWAGRVKIYGCYSASHWTAAVPYFGWVLWRSQSFAKQVYDRLRVTHPKVEVYGYTHSVPMSPTKGNGEGPIELHKYVNKEKTETARKYLVRVQ